MLGEREILDAMAAASGGPVQTMPADDEDDDRAGADLLSSAQRRQIERVLKRVGGNKTEAARLLGISRRALYRWLERLELTGRLVERRAERISDRRRDRPAGCPR